MYCNISVCSYINPSSRFPSSMMCMYFTWIIMLGPLTGCGKAHHLISDTARVGVISLVGTLGTGWVGSSWGWTMICQDTDTLRLTNSQWFMCNKLTWQTSTGIYKLTVKEIITFDYGTFIILYSNSDISKGLAVTLRIDSERQRENLAGTIMDELNKDMFVGMFVN